MQRFSLCCRRNKCNHKINKMQKKYQRTNNKCWLWKMCKIKENYEYYKELQEARGNFNYVYNKKEYPHGFTSEDKKVVDNRYSPSNPRFTKKHFLLILSTVILVLIFSQILRKCL